MSSEVKRYSVVLHVANDSPFRQTGDSCTRPIRTDVVLATDYAALESECERLRQFEIAYNDWQAKTDWVQESAKPNELGRHRADVLRARIEALAAQQGEAVEVAQVVSYLSACADGYDPDAPHPGPPEPLMTVAQHNRILAALSAQQSAQHPDDAAVDRFAAAMKSKLAKSREKGRHGWQTASAAHLSSLLYHHMYKADPLDVANLAMMLHQNGQVIELPFEARMPKEQQSAPERVSVPVEFRKVADKILAKLIRFADCAEDFEAGGVDIGRDWLDTLTRLGLLERVQRSPALWQTTDEADAIIDAQRALLASHGRGEA